MLKKPETPPMGWNSWDCYGAAVTEEQVRANARYMAEHLKEYGWEYVVVDIQWYESTADGSRMHGFMPLCMDEYGRLVPAENRFPSARDGKGFGPLAEYVHSLGLKFGIHIMRGIPRQAVHADTPVLGSNLGARHAAKYASICPWCTDNYGVDPLSPNGQAYYDSIFRLYAQWGVDYVKVDDIAFNALEGGRMIEDEIIMIHRAIDRCGRDMICLLYTSYTDKNAKEGQTYYYTARAYHGDDLSTYEKFPGITVLACPEFTMTNGTNGVTIGWEKVTGAETYRVYRRTSATGSWTQLTEMSGLSYTDKTAKSGTTYYYTVRAYAGSNSSRYISDSTICFLENPQVETSCVKGVVTVSWEKITGASGYQMCIRDRR